MKNIQDLKDLRLHDFLHLPLFEGHFPNGESDEERIKKFFSETTHSQVWVTDDDSVGYCVFVYDTKGVNKDKLLVVTNNDSKSLFLWSIDGKMFTKLSKCDCALISDLKLHLVEFKANVVSENLDSIGTHYDKASNQLSLTFEYIKEAYTNLKEDLFDVFSDVDAQIVFDKQIPQNSAYQKSVIAKFLKKNDITLSFGNELKL